MLYLVFFFFLLIGFLTCCLRLMTNMLFKIDDGLFFPWWVGPVTFFFF